MANLSDRTAFIISEVVVSRARKPSAKSVRLVIASEIVVCESPLVTVTTHNHIAASDRAQSVEELDYDLKSLNR